MAFWCRAKQLQVRTISNQFRRCYFRSQGSSLLHRTVSHAGIQVFDKPILVFQKNKSQFPGSVRFFAAPVQAKQKKEEDQSGPRLNEQITAEYVRLVTDEGHGIVSRKEALEHARRLKLDLVEVQRSAKPPVCKLMDYNKEKYNQQIKEKDHAKSKSEMTLRKGGCKEVRFSGKIAENDLKLKADMVKRLMDRGYRVKCMATGSEGEDLEGLLSRLLPMIDDVSTVESGPRVEKRQAYVIVRHVKFGPSKKGSAKKASKAIEAMGPAVEKVAVSSNTTHLSAQSVTQYEENRDGAISDMESEEGNLYEDGSISPSLEVQNEAVEQSESGWSVADGSDDFDKFFYFKAPEQIKSAPVSSSSSANTLLESVGPGRKIISTPAQADLSSPAGAPLGTLNRYRSEPSNNFRKPMDGKGTKGGSSMRSELQVSNQGRQSRVDMNVSHQGRRTEKAETTSSLFSNLRLPTDDINVPSPPASSYGIFSAPVADNTPGELSAPAENRYKKRNPTDSSRNFGPVGLSSSTDTNRYGPGSSGGKR